jgi:hypothetical protein
MKLARCMECGERCHLKCASERESRKIEINTHVFDNLDEFFKSGRSKKVKDEDDDDIRMSFDYIEDIADIRNAKKKDKDSKSRKYFGDSNVLVPDSPGKK